MQTAKYDVPMPLHRELCPVLSCKFTLKAPYFLSGKVMQSAKYDVPMPLHRELCLILSCKIHFKVVRCSSTTIFVIIHQFSTGCENVEYLSTK